MEYNLVPMAPTREMIEAGQNLLFIEDIYRAMIAAAPSPSWIPVNERLPDWEPGLDRWVDQWYWVTNGKSSWPAIYDPASAGGWTNEDTWEDFDREVIAWLPIQTPPAPPTAAPVSPSSDDHTPQAPASVPGSK